MEGSPDSAFTPQAHTEGGGTQASARRRRPSDSLSLPSSTAKSEKGPIVFTSRTRWQRMVAPLVALLPRSDLPGARQKTPWGVSRWFLLLLYGLYTFATSAVFYGWTALSELIFTNEGFAYLCLKDPLTGVYDPDLRLQGKLYICDSQDAAVQKLYTLTFAVCCTMSACAGTLLDGLGPLFTALLGQIFNVTGWLLFSFASPHFSAYHAAFVFIGLGSDTSFLPTLTIRRLFPGSAGLIITIMGSAASASFGVPLILSAVVKEAHTSVRTAALAYCAVGPALCMVVAVLFIPRRGFSIDDEGEIWDDVVVADGSLNKDQAREIDPQDPAKNADRQSDANGEEEAVADVARDQAKTRAVVRNAVLQQVSQLRDSFWSRSFRKQLFSVRFGLIVTYFIVVGWSSAYFQQAARRMFSSSVVRVMEVLLPFSFLPCIILGKLADIFGIVRILFVVNSSGVLMYALSFAKDADPAGYLSVVFFTIYMSLFTSQVFVYIEETFSPQHFGKLIGMASMVGGLLSLITNPLYEDITLKKDHGNPLSIQIVMTVLLCLQYGTIMALGLLRRKNPKPYATKEAHAETMNLPGTTQRSKDSAVSRQNSSSHAPGGETDISAERGSCGESDSVEKVSRLTAPATRGRSASTELV